ncbi:unnamed protein product [Paramecium pentaurelia]|uniref:non-specific serine/threonine protein kinase n=1 Tax=Paramecium pentaurelia TaxID=43138 RepID=A0A8S1TJ01_9CILI|nr:unnamed protein product [Paramecium pentaurelia]
MLNNQKAYVEQKFQDFQVNSKQNQQYYFSQMKQKKIIEIDGIKITKANKIKHGAEAKIYEGYLNQNEHQKVALKKHKEKFTNEQILLLKILKEQINDHIIEIIAFGQTQKGKCYIVMELGNQIDLMNLANKQQTCLEMAKSIQILHKYGYFHRDLKPENFVISQKGKIKLIDFGIAKKMNDNLFMSFNGTYDYIAPEILISKEYDASVDIWNLGVIFFEVLEGKQFFRLLNLDRIQDYIIISQIQINRIIKAQKNLQNKEVEILNKMIVQRLNIQTDCSLNKSIQRIKINDLVDELENMYNLDISISSLIVENKFLNWEIISEFNGSSVSINQSLSIQNSNKSQIEDIILKNDQVNDIPKSASLSMWINKEEINNHQMCGEYGKYLNKKGKWIAIWKGEQLQNVGGVYDDEGKRKRIWKELFHNFRSQAQVYEVGEYINSKRSGIWKYFYKDLEMQEYLYLLYLNAQGMYNEFGQKNGKWIELSERFQKHIKIIKLQVNAKQFMMVYMKMVIKLVNGIQCIDREINFNQLVEDFMKQRKVIITRLKLEAGLNQLKVPVQSLMKVHIIMGQKLEIGKFFGIKMEINEKIGGGSYESKEYNNQLLKSQKIGNWIELIDNYQKIIQKWQESQQMDTIYIQNQQNEIMQHNLKQQIFKSGDGSYLENLVNCEDSIKIGRWIELSDNFKMDSQQSMLAHIKIKIKLVNGIFFIKIGGGCYEITKGDDNNVFFQIKNGMWIELSDRFDSFNQVIFKGDYKYGKKVGRWYKMKRQGKKIKDDFYKIKEEYYRN